MQVKMRFFIKLCFDQFTDSQESILQVEIDDVVGGNLESPTLSTDLRSEGRITPLPQIRAEIASNRQVCIFYVSYHHTLELSTKSTFIIYLLL